jgi:hypothetical protein
MSTALKAYLPGIIGLWEQDTDVAAGVLQPGA